MKTQEAAADLARALDNDESKLPAEAIAALVANGIGALERIADALEKIAAHPARSRESLVEQINSAVRDGLLRSFP